MKYFTKITKELIDGLNNETNANIKHFPESLICINGSSFSFHELNETIDLLDDGFEHTLNQYFVELVKKQFPIFIFEGKEYGSVTELVYELANKGHIDLDHKNMVVKNK